MDLKDLIKEYLENGEEAFRAFNAGHPETSEKLFKRNGDLIREYFAGKATPVGDVTKSATSEKTAETSQATPVQPAGPEAKAPGVVPFVAPPKIHPASRLEKPNQ